MYILNTENEDVRLLHQEWNLLQFCAHFENIMEQKNITRGDLAKRLGTDKSYVSKILDGANLTIKKITDVLLALDSSLSIDTILGIELVTNLQPISQNLAEVEEVLEHREEEYHEIDQIKKQSDTQVDSFIKYSELLTAA